MGKLNDAVTGEPLKDADVVTVCDHCLRACCWQGEFMCDYADCAGTVDKTVGELRAEKHGEHESYWRGSLRSPHLPKGQ